MNVLTVTLIVFVYTLSLILSVTYFNYQNFSQKVSYDNELSLTTNADSIDKWFNNLMQFSSNLTSKALIQDYLNKNGSSYTYFPEVYDELVDTQQLNFQSDLRIGITKSDDDRIVSHNGYYTRNDYLKFMNIDQYQFQNFLDDFLDEQYHYRIVSHKTDNKQYLTLLERKNYAQSKNELITFMTFPVDELGGSSLATNSDLYMNYDKQNIAISDGHLLQPQKELNSFMTSIDYSNNENQQASLNSFEKDSLTAYIIPSESIGNLNYVQLSSLTLSDLFTQDFAQHIALIIILLILFGSLICFYAIQKVYRPIKVILSLINSKIQSPLLQKDEFFNELTFIENNFDELYSENLELKASKESTINTLQSDFLIQLFSGELPSPILLEHLEEVQLSEYLDGGILALLTLEGFSLEETKFTRENLLTFRSKMLTVITSSKPTLDYKLIPLDYQNFCILFPVKSNEQVAEILTSIIPNIESQLNRNLTFSVAAEVDSIDQFKDAFDEVSKRMQDKFKYTNTQLIFPDTEEITDSQLLPYTFEEERKLFNAVIDNDLESANFFIQSILNHLFQSGELNSFKITEYKIVLFNTIKRILNHQEQSFPEFYKTNRPLFNQLSTSSIEVIYTTFQKIFEVLFSNCIFSHSVTTDPTTLNIIEYIDQNYMKDLALTDLSDEFELSENYISRLLKKNADINFKAYITELKIAKSKELLQQGKYNVTEVSELVGYKHVNTFIRTFKKHVGYSPGEFSKVTI